MGRPWTLSLLAGSMVLLTFLHSLPAAGMPFDVLEEDLDDLDDEHTDEKLVSRHRKRDVYVTFEDRAQSICIGLCMYYDMKPYDKCLDRCRLGSKEFQLGGDWFGREEGQTQSAAWLNTTTVAPPGGGAGGRGITSSPPGRGPPFYATYTYNIYNPNCHPRHKQPKQDYLSRLRDEWLEKLRNRSAASGAGGKHGAAGERENIFTVVSGSLPHRKIHKGTVIYRDRYTNRTWHGGRLSPGGGGRGGALGPRRPGGGGRGYHLEGVHIHRPKDPPPVPPDVRTPSTLQPPIGSSKSTATCCMQAPPGVQLLTTLLLLGQTLILKSLVWHTSQSYS